MLFSKKWLKNHPPFLLHFLIHIDVLMLCRKFELIPTQTFRVMSIFKNKYIYNVVIPLGCYGSAIVQNKRHSNVF